MIAALYVDAAGCYANIPDVDVWDEARDARLYPGPWPVVAHPPCKRWGRFATGSPRKPNQFRVGDDGGCFAAALASVRAWGGVLEHPRDSKAWDWFGLRKPRIGAGWIEADDRGGMTCVVEQGHYGHVANKATWLYACRTELPELNWTRGAQRLNPIVLERHGYARARKAGLVSLIGGKDKERIRNATPVPFRDILLEMAASVRCHEPAKE